MTEPNDAWPAPQKGWEHEQHSGGHFVFKPAARGDVRLDLGDVPDRTKITVANNANRQLTISATSARYTEITIRNPVRGLTLEGKFNRVEATATSRSTFDADQAPTTLVLHGGDWHLAQRPDNDRLRVEIDSADNVTIEQGNPVTIHGKCKSLILGALKGQPDIEIAGHLRTTQPSDFATVQCTSLMADSSIKATSFTVTGASRGWGIAAAGKLVAENIHAGRSVHAHAIRCAALTIDDGHVWISQQGLNTQQTDQLGKVKQSEGDGPSLVARPQQPQPSTFGVVELHKGSLTGGSVAVGTKLRVAGPVSLTELQSEQAAEIAAGDLLVGAVNAPLATMTATTSARITQSSKFKTLTAPAIWLDADTHCDALTVDKLTVKAAVGPASDKLDVTATTRCLIAGGASIEGNLLIAGGTATVEPEATVNTLIAEPAADAATVDVHGTVTELHAIGTRQAVNLSGPALAAGDTSVEIAGEVTVTAAQPERSKDPIRSRSIVWRDGADLTISADAAKECVVELVASSPRGNLDLTTTGSSSVHARFNGPATVHVNAHTSTKIEATETADGALTLTLDGNRPADLVGRFAKLRVLSRECGVGIPTQTVIDDARGDIWVTSLCGSITSSRDDEKPARLVQLQPVGEDDLVGATARLTGLDLTQLRHQEVDALDDAEYVEPDRKSLLTYATEPNLANADVRARSQWMLNLHQLVDTMAVSGSVRSAVAWSAAKLQHRATKRGKAGWEWCARQLHRLVGYGYKWWPPLLVWIAAAAVVSLFSLDASAIDWSGACDHSAEVTTLNTVNGIVEFTTTTESQCASSFGEWGDEFVATLFFPFRLLRLSPDANVFAYLPAGVQPLAGVAIGLPFLFVLISIRRFFKLTHDG